MSIADVRASDIQDAIDADDDLIYCADCCDFTHKSDDVCAVCGSNLVTNNDDLPYYLEVAQEREAEARIQWEQTHGTPLLPHIEEAV